MFGNVLMISLLIGLIILQIASVISLHSDFKERKRPIEKKDDRFKLFCESSKYEPESSLVDKKGME